MARHCAFVAACTGEDGDDEEQGRTRTLRRPGRRIVSDRCHPNLLVFWPCLYSLVVLVMFVVL